MTASIAFSAPSKNQSVTNCLMPASSNTLHAKVDYITNKNSHQSVPSALYRFRYPQGSEQYYQDRSSARIFHEILQFTSKKVASLKTFQSILRIVARKIPLGSVSFTPTRTLNESLHPRAILKKSWNVEKETCKLQR